MPFSIVLGDITQQAVDAIVNAANPTLLGGGGVDGCIHRAAGPELLAECRTLGGCRTGEAKLTKGYRLPANYVIHTVGPIWQGGGQGERQLLESCYRNALELAIGHNLESVAFPLISAGVYGYPKGEALKIAVSTIGGVLERFDLDVRLVLYRKEEFVPDRALTEGIERYLQRKEDFACAAYSVRMPRAAFCMPPDLNGIEKRIGKSFSEYLLAKIDEKGLSDVECYRRANVDRKLFSKIRSNPDYHPQKNTALAFAVALRLNYGETQELLRTAGYTLSDSSKSDLIVGYFIERGEFDIYRINEALFGFDQKLLGQA